MFDPLVGKIPWGRERQPAPVFLTGKSRGWRSLLGYSLWGRKKSDMSEQLHFFKLLNGWRKSQLGHGMIRWQRDGFRVREKLTSQDTEVKNLTDQGPVAQSFRANAERESYQNAPWTHILTPALSCNKIYLPSECLIIIFPTPNACLDFKLY